MRIFAVIFIAICLALPKLSYSQELAPVSRAHSLQLFHGAGLDFQRFSIISDQVSNRSASLNNEKASNHRSFLIRLTFAPIIPEYAEFMGIQISYIPQKTIDQGEKYTITEKYGTLRNETTYELPEDAESRLVEIGMFAGHSINVDRFTLQAGLGLHMLVGYHQLNLPAFNADNIETVSIGLGLSFFTGLDVKAVRRISFSFLGQALYGVQVSNVAKIFAQYSAFAGVKYFYL